MSLFENKVNVGGSVAPLGGVKNPSAVRRGLSRLRELDDLIDLPGRHPGLVGVDGGVDGWQKSLQPPCR